MSIQLLATLLKSVFIQPAISLLIDLDGNEVSTNFNPPYSETWPRARYLVVLLVAKMAWQTEKGDFGLVFQPLVIIF